MLMLISDFAIRRPIVTIVTMIALVAFGLAALANLQTDEFPDIEAPIVFIGIAYPGASPDVVEREVIDRVEDRIAGISGVDKINSSAVDGFAQVIVTFVFSKDVNQATQDVRDALSEIRSQLPAESSEPLIQHFDPNEQPIVSLTLTSKTMSAAQLTGLADPGITGDLRSIPGVAQVNVQGADSAEMDVLLDPARLQSAGVSVQEVVGALTSQNLAAPVGSVNGPLQQRTIRLEGRLSSPQDFLNIAVANRGGHLVRLREVADVEETHAEPRSSALYNGKQAIGLDIIKAREYSTTEVSDAVKARVAQIQKRLPEGTTIETVRDAGVRVSQSVSNVEEALIEGALLTVLVVFLFLNSWRSTVITGLALPVSVLASFIAVWAFGFTLNTMSLLGLSLAIGILIDDAIVVRENIVRHIEMGVDHTTAAHEGTDEIGLAVAATTFSIICVFVPVAFMSGMAGQWFKPFALTIACAVLVSLFVSFSLDPMLSAYWPDPQLERHQLRNPIARTLARFNAWFDRQADSYKGVIAWALDHRMAMIGIAAASFVLAIALQLWIGGFEFVPPSDRSELNIAIETPPGSNLDYTTIKAEEVARLVRSMPQVAYTYTTVGASTGASVWDQGNVYVRLVPKADRSISQEALSVRIRARLRKIAGVTAYTYASGFGGNQKQIQLQLNGPDVNRLTSLAEQLANVVRKVPGAVDVGLSTKGQKPEFDVHVNRSLASTMGVSLAEVAQALRAAFAGVYAGTWIDQDGQTRYVEVRLARQYRENAADIAQLPIVVGGGAAGGGGAGTGGAAGGSGGSGGSGAAAGPATIPLQQIATITPTVGPAQIDHYQRQRVVTVGANTEGAPLGQVTQAINARLGQVPLPPGYTISYGGQVENQQKVFTDIFTALGIAVLLMYLVLVVQFGSFLDPIAILISLPLSLIGVVIALIVTGDTINLMSLIGIILLMGIVVKNAILLIDFAKWSTERGGLSTRDALIEAGRIRLRPIIMTTLALIAGMFPVALGAGEGADFRAPLGRAVIGGVIASTMLTLIVIPTVYEILDDWRARALARLGRGRLGAHHRPAEAAGDD